MNLQLAAAVSLSMVVIASFANVVFLPEPLNAYTITYEETFTETEPTFGEKLSDEELYCLAQNIYFESRGESYIGQVFTAWTTINRMHDARWPDTLCGVVWQDKQFSWTHDGKSDIPKDMVAWERAKFIAEAVWEDSVRNRMLDPTEGALYFHNRSVKPVWTKDFKKLASIDNHIFYR